MCIKERSVGGSVARQIEPQKLVNQISHLIRLNPSSLQMHRLCALQHIKLDKQRKIIVIGWATFKLI